MSVDGSGTYTELVKFSGFESGHGDAKMGLRQLEQGLSLFLLNFWHSI